jgi:hypothetical protein
MESENENNLESDIESETGTDLENEIANQLQNEITNQLEIEITNQLQNEITNQLQNGIGSVLDNYLQNHNPPQQINNYTTFNNYLSERNHFENDLYDHLVGSVSFNGIHFVYIHGMGHDTIENAINDDFWDPVVVSYDKVELLEIVDEQSNCSICTEDQDSFKRLKCCSQKLCFGCCEEWFGRSVKCPYCHQDLRDFDN